MYEYGNSTDSCDCVRGRLPHCTAAARLRVRCWDLGELNAGAQAAWRRRPGYTLYDSSYSYSLPASLLCGGCVSTLIHSSELAPCLASLVHTTSRSSTPGTHVVTAWRHLVYGYSLNTFASPGCGHVYPGGAAHRHGQRGRHKSPPAGTCTRASACTAARTVAPQARTPRRTPAHASPPCR